MLPAMLLPADYVVISEIMSRIAGTGRCNADEIFGDTRANRFRRKVEFTTIVLSKARLGNADVFRDARLCNAVQRQRAHKLPSGAGSIYLYGEIAYLDMLGEQRETGFCCEWNFAEGQFFMAPDTKLNYYT